MTVIRGSSEFPVLLPRRRKSAVGSCLHYNQKASIGLKTTEDKL